MNFILFALMPIAWLMVCIIMNCNSYKDYRSVYKMLPFKTFYRSGNLVYSRGFYEKDNGFAWFLNSNTFALTKGTFLHNAFYTWCDPFSAYWIRKFQGWFKENVNPDNLPEHCPPSNYPAKMKAEHEFSSVYSYDAYLRRYYAEVALRTLVNKDAPTQEIVKNVVELATKLVAELRFKEKMEN